MSGVTFTLTIIEIYIGVHIQYELYIRFFISVGTGKISLQLNVPLNIIPCHPNIPRPLKS